MALTGMVRRACRRLGFASKDQGALLAPPIVRLRATARWLRRAVVAVPRELSTKDWEDSDVERRVLMRVALLARKAVTKYHCGTAAGAASRADAGGVTTAGAEVTRAYSEAKTASHNIRTSASESSA